MNEAELDFEYVDDDGQGNIVLRVPLYKVFNTCTGGGMQNSDKCNEF